jgi:effector-binding domain-containing protein
MQAQIKDDPAAIFLASRHRTTIPQIAKIAGDENAPGKLIEAARSAGIQIAGPSTFIYYGADGKPTTEFDLLIAFPIVSRPASVPNGFEVVEAPPFHCVSVDYVGSMPNIHAGYDVLMQAIGSQGLRPTGEGREIYKTWVEYNSDENVTELQIGIEK